MEIGRRHVIQRSCTFFCHCDPVLQNWGNNLVFKNVLDLRLRRRIPFLIFCLLLLFGSLYAKQKTNLPQKAKPFALYDLNDNLVKYSDFEGKKVIVLSFFATWCKPCILEIHGLKKLNLDSKKVEVLLITNEKKKKVAPFIKKHEINFKVLLDIYNVVSKSYKVKGLPTIFLIDKKDGIVFKQEGFSKQTIKKIDTKIKELIR